MYLNTAFEYLNTVFEYLNAVFEYLNAVFESLNTVFEYLNAVFEYLNAVFEYLIAATVAPWCNRGVVTSSSNGCTGASRSRAVCRFSIAIAIAATSRCAVCDRTRQGRRATPCSNTERNGVKFNVRLRLRKLPCSNAY